MGNFGEVQNKKVEDWLREAFLKQQGKERLEMCMSNQYMIITTMYDGLNENEQEAVMHYANSIRCEVNGTALYNKLAQGFLLYSIGMDRWKDIELYIRSAIYDHIMRPERDSKFKCISGGVC